MVNWKCGWWRAEFQPGDPVWVKVMEFDADGEGHLFSFPGWIVGPAKSLSGWVVVIERGALDLEEIIYFVPRPRELDKHPEVGFVRASGHKLKRREGIREALCSVCDVPRRLPVHDRSYCPAGPGGVMP